MILRSVFSRAKLHQAKVLRQSTRVRELCLYKHDSGYVDTALSHRKYGLSCRSISLGREEPVTETKLSFSGGAINMDHDLVELVRKIHASPTLAVFYVAGGGLQVLILPAQAHQHCTICLHEHWQKRLGTLSQQKPLCMDRH